jgi:glutaredoxin
MPARIQFLKRKRCHLCEEALAVLQRACQARGLMFDLIDIDDTPGYQAYSEQIPVLLVDGRKIFKYRFPEKRLARALDRI